MCVVQELKCSAEVLALSTACVRLHQAVVGAYTGAAPGREEDAWRAALVQQHIASRAAAAGPVLLQWAEQQPEKTLPHAEPRALVAPCHGLMAAALLQQTAQRAGRSGERRATSHEQDTDASAAWMVARLEERVHDVADNLHMIRSTVLWWHSCFTTLPA